MTLFSRHNFALTKQNAVSSEIETIQFITYDKMNCNLNRFVAENILIGRDDSKVVSATNHSACKSPEKSLYERSESSVWNERICQPQLTETCSPSCFDVICGRGKGSYNRPGNKRFRSIVASYVERYLASKTKDDKSMILALIIERIHEQNNRNAHFLKYDSECMVWRKMSTEEAREKVGHAMREAISLRERLPIKRDKQFHLMIKQNDLRTLQKNIFNELRRQLN